MTSIIPNKNRSNYEFEVYVRKKIKEFNKKGNIVARVKYRTNDVGRYIGAIINYK